MKSDLELVQNTCLTVLRYLDSFRKEARFKNWLFRIAVTSCLRMKGGRKIRSKGEVPFDEEINLEETSPPEIKPAWVMEPEKELLNRELKEVIDKAVHKLPPPYRLAFILRDQEDFSTREAARIMNISGGAVKTRLHRARAFLAQKIRNYLEDDGHGRN